MAYPALYKRGIKGMEYTRTRFVIYMLEATWQSLVLFYVPYFCYGAGTTWSSTGRDMDSLTILGTTVAVNAVIVATVGVLINYHIYNIFAVIGASLSILAVIVWIPIYSSFGVFNFAGASTELYASPLFWLTIPATIVIAVGPRLILKMFRELYMPLDQDIIREAVGRAIVIDRVSCSSVRHHSGTTGFTLKRNPRQDRPSPNRKRSGSARHHQSFRASTASQQCRHRTATATPPRTTRARAPASSRCGKIPSLNQTHTLKRPVHRQRTANHPP